MTTAEIALALTDLERFLEGAREHTRTTPALMNAEEMRRRRLADLDTYLEAVRACRQKCLDAIAKKSKGEPKS